MVLETKIDNSGKCIDERKELHARNSYVTTVVNGLKRRRTKESSAGKREWEERLLGIFFSLLSQFWNGYRTDEKYEHNNNNSSSNSRTKKSVHKKKTFIPTLFRVFLHLLNFQQMPPYLYSSKSQALLRFTSFIWKNRSIFFLQMWFSVRVHSRATTTFDSKTFEMNYPTLLPMDAQNGYSDGIPSSSKKIPYGFQANKDQFLLE